MENLRGAEAEWAPDAQSRVRVRVCRARARVRVRATCALATCVRACNRACVIGFLIRVQLTELRSAERKAESCYWNSSSSLH